MWEVPNEGIISDASYARADVSNDGSTGRVNGYLRRIRTSEIGLRDDENEKAGD